MEIISVKECLACMETGQQFTATYVSYDRRRKKGGQIKTIQAMFLPKTQTPAVDGQRMPTPNEQKKSELQALRRNPNHRKWYTRNVALSVDGFATSEIRSIHPPLFLTFNSKKVVP